jgi:hypothetical protein
MGAFPVSTQHIREATMPPRMIVVTVTRRITRTRTRLGATQCRFVADTLDGQRPGQPRKEIKMLRSILAAIGLVVATTVSPASAHAAQPVNQTLNPPPPDFYTCMAVGGGTICHGSQTLPYGPDDTDIVCGSGPTAFDIFDSGVTNDQATRWYDADGNLTRRFVRSHETAGAWSNPVTGKVVPYSQTDAVTTVLTTPGDFGSAIETNVGENIYRTVDGGHPIMFSVGRFVIDDKDGDLLFSSGKQWVVELFFENNPAVLDDVCAALS